MFKAYKYELRPTEKQKILMEKHFGVNRFVYNWALQQKKKYYAESKKSLHKYEIIKKLTALKKENDWMCEVASQSMQQAIINLETAFTAFFKKRSNFPKFKSKKFNKKSYTVPQGISINFEEESVKLPKLKSVRYYRDRKFDGEIKQATISSNKIGRYFVSILVDTGVQVLDKKDPKLSSTLGIDLGIKDFAITSNSDVFKNPKYLESSQKRLGLYQKRFSKTIKGSRNREKLKLKIAKLHWHISNQRKDFQHKVSARIARSDNQTSVISMETLSIKNLLKNKNLAKHISDVAWHQFKTFVEYKCEWNGKHFIQIGQFEPSSKTCNICGWYNSGLTLSIRSWACQGCGTVHDRDINAACNIRDFGWLVLEKELGVVDAALSINKARFSGDSLESSNEIGKAQEVGPDLATSARTS